MGNIREDVVQRAVSETGDVGDAETCLRFVDWKSGDGFSTGAESATNFRQVRSVEVAAAFELSEK